MKRIAAISFAILFLTSCAGSHNTGNSFVGNISNDGAQQIAMDAVTYLIT